MKEIKFNFTEEPKNIYQFVWYTKLKAFYQDISLNLSFGFRSTLKAVQIDYFFCSFLKSSILFYIMLHYYMPINA